MLTVGAFIAIVAATFVAEDATAAGVGLAIREGSVAPVAGVVACLVGIYIGDVGLWAIGRIAGRRILAWPRLARLPLATLESLGSWVDRHPAGAIIGSRFTPGLRLPMYVAAGIWGERPWRFLIWMFVAVTLWTPALVVLAAFAGHAVAGRLHGWLGGGWTARIGSVLVTFAIVYALLGASSSAGRARLAARLARLRQWEFWPAWLVNAPVALWIAWLAIRHRSVTVFTAANPGIEAGGVVGESKSAILAKLPDAWVLPWVLIEPGSPAARLARLRAGVTCLGGAYPFVLKPDVGERGVGVRWIRSEEDARAYLANEPGPVLLQVAHEGPFEAGVFYVRHPCAPHGYVFSITDKRFPCIVGDGRSTIEALVLAHPRYRLQAGVFLARHAAQRDRVPTEGETVRLARAGNHAQGTEFRDGRHLLTPALEARVEEIARQFEGFFFGRFDVRYRDREAFMAGRDFSIVELNGVTSEATHIYDPSSSLISAWRTLMQQWSLAFSIGAANQQNGYRPIPLERLVRLVAAYLGSRPAHSLAD